MTLPPNALGFTMPAEWKPHAGCWMAWPCHQATWAAIGLPRARSAFARVARAIAQYEPVTMLVNPGDEADAAEQCGPGIQLCSVLLNDSWLRDTGPTFLLNAAGQLAGVDWDYNAWGGNYKDFELDKALASKILDLTGAIPFKAPLVMEGGAFHVDGEGTILTTRECLLNPNRNPLLSEAAIEASLHEYLGAKKIIWLNKGLVGDETDGHIDEIACFIAPGKVLCLITQNERDENFAILQENYALLTAATDSRGRHLEVYTVEQPPATFLNGNRLTLSYINFYRANQGLVIPAFGYPEQDSAAYGLFQQLFPGYSITSVEALDIFAGGGGIHCITQQQPV